jgi:hypothetical protein
MGWSLPTVRSRPQDAGPAGQAVDAEEGAYPKVLAQPGLANPPIGMNSLRADDQISASKLLGFENSVRIKMLRAYRATVAKSRQEECPPHT